MRIRNVLAAVVLALVTVPAMGQDLLARQAPVDRRMKSIDSISLHRMLPMMYELQEPSNDLYPEWSNARGSKYSVQKPKEYKIDLRHFCMPCDSRLVTSHFGWRSQFGRNHYGTDIKLYTGDTVRAAFAGKVRVVAYEAGGYGNYVILRHNNGLETVYGHMSKHLVRENETVRAGEPIGLGGNTGRSTGSHLHFETRFLGENIDPEKMFDFQAQDAKGDYYVYRSNGGSHVSGDAHHADSPVNLIANKRIVKRDEVASAADDEKEATSKSKRSKKNRKKKGDSEQQIINDIEQDVAANATTATGNKQQAQADGKQMAQADSKQLAQADSKQLAQADSKADDAKQTVKSDKKKARKEKKQERVYSVKQGDTLYDIARKNGVTVEKLCKANGIKEGATLRLGQKIKFS